MNKIFIITGEQGQGKSTFVKNLVDSLRKRNIQVAGILAPGYWKHNEREKFELIDLHTDKKIIFCKTAHEDGWQKIRKFYIYPEGQKFGEKALHPATLKQAEITVIDEIGPFELEGKGWAASLNIILQEVNNPLLLVVRKSLVDKVIRKWNLKDPELIDISNQTTEDLLKYILAKI